MRLTFFSFAGSISDGITSKISSGAIGARNIAAGGAKMVTKGIGKMALVKTANFMDNMGFKSAAGMVSGSRQNNFLKAGGTKIFLDVRTNKAGRFFVGCTA